MTTAVVPVKSLAQSKSRLLPTFAAAEREALCLAMLEDILAALAEVEPVTRRAVVTPDRTVARAARAAGADALLLDDDGLNPSLEAAARELALSGDDALLVVLGDVAAARPEDLAALIAARSELGDKAVLLAPASDGGTAALLRAPFDAIPAQFGADSARRHAAAARELGVPFRSVPLPSLALDIDSGEDLERFFQMEGAGRNTRALLERLRRTVPA
ncbi:MAG: 2-phospho-L-lactate guanylyltransferase [Proteobacteria bacterium]|nr:2-phospho-L-lactate guanylyltransferase [Pseudomonadota bacterium]